MRLIRSLPLLAAVLAVLPLAALASPPPSDWQNAPVCNGKYSAQMKHTFYQTATTAGVRTEVGVVRHPFAQGSVPNPSYYLIKAEISSRNDANPKWTLDSRERDGFDSYSGEPMQLGTVVFKSPGCKLMASAQVSVKCPDSTEMEHKTFTRSWDGCGQ